MEVNDWALSKYIFKWNFKLTKKFIILFPSGSEPKFEMTGRFVKKPRYFDKNY